MIEVIYNLVVYVLNIPLEIFKLLKPNDEVIIFHKGSDESCGRRVNVEDLTVKDD